MIKLDWNDISIIPSKISKIDSRSEINPFDENGKLPIYTAPMDMVIDNDNVSLFDDNKINICLPRNIKTNDNNHFHSFGLDEIINMFNNDQKMPNRILIDIANGNMNKLFDISKKIKNKYGDKIELMVGNIANPKTYKELCKIGVDYVRSGVGAGSACFIEGTKIKTVDGYKNIECVENGDVVLTHTGQYKLVINKISYKSYDNLLSVNNNISTKDHEYYVVEKRNIDLLNDDNIHQYCKWIKARELDKNIHYLVKSNKSV